MDHEKNLKHLRDVAFVFRLFILLSLLVFYRSVHKRYCLQCREPVMASSRWGQETQWAGEPFVREGEAFPQHPLACRNDRRGQDK